jgi:hypothetical protein
MEENEDVTLEELRGSKRDRIIRWLEYEPWEPAIPFDFGAKE